MKVAPQAPAQLPQVTFKPPIFFFFLLSFPFFGGGGGSLAKIILKVDVIIEIS